MLTRSPRNRRDGIKEIAWDGKSLGDWAKLVDGAEVVVNLAGRSVDCRYHARNRRLILESRVDSTRVLGEAVAQCAKPPRVWLNSSTATIYKHTFGPAWDESGEIGGTPAAKDEFSVEVARDWEQAFAKARTPATRKVALRSGMVLGTEKNSVFPVLRRLVRFGLGGKMASGNQYVSWIHEADFCRAVDWLINRDDFSGAVNLASPNPIPNREMMRTLREICGVPFGLPATLWMLGGGSVLSANGNRVDHQEPARRAGTVVGVGVSISFSEPSRGTKGFVRQNGGLKCSSRTSTNRPCRRQVR